MTLMRRIADGKFLGVREGDLNGRGFAVRATLPFWLRYRFLYLAILAKTDQQCQ
jgi:hypothetical protein